MPRNLYTELGVSRSATTAEIKQAYRRLALMYHPDVNPSEEASAMFSRISEAYDTLADTTRRRVYDSSLLPPAPRSGPVAPPRAQATSSDPSVEAVQAFKEARAYAKVHQGARVTPDKYKSDAWRRLSLSARKASRVQPMHSMRGSLAGLAFVSVAAAGASAAIYFGAV
mmetsp:Transcript_1528/g.5298  ORF Transcript_1528/g.5298 Transcript_1528/m.5298 type:complete len:169 (+) Transcript_1528:303-809(+)